MKKKRDSKRLNKLRLQRLDNLSELKLYARRKKMVYFSYLVILSLILLTLLGIYFLIF